MIEHGFKQTLTELDKDKQENVLINVGGDGERSGEYLCGLRQFIHYIHQTYVPISLSLVSSCLILQITWWNGTLELTDTQKWRIAHENGTGSAKRRVAIKLSRADLGRKLTCEVNRDGRTSLTTTKHVYADATG